MPRKELTKSAMQIADVIYRKGAEKADREIAEKIGIDPSNLCRFKANYLELVCAYLAEIGLGVYDLAQDKPVPKEQLKALSVLARGGHDKFDEEFLGQ
ncbi:hypothetical protein F543_1970 [Bibersteinia trehalosi USDA-ARS-USMARC-189]|uniref:Uncharacterized protein n=3 Tax=Bibersteinia trehalosi TaxID=47735 RepID=W0RD91_BIBTR|nr:CII family transcriptional regulator [Bibersteinia trehalosi]AHG83061.1 hypothetical protein F543_1970 [Bibersteinia trehalosi USDA-ARS-USMARC-189]AHG87353.1 hypothetical protein F544_21250 [Bibersteinia trehalosi USDA-ARS-USMARC-190]